MLFDLFLLFVLSSRVVPLFVVTVALTFGVYCIYRRGIHFKKIDWFIMGGYSVLTLLLILLD